MRFIVLCFLSITLVSPVWGAGSDEAEGGSYTYYRSGDNLTAEPDGVAFEMLDPGITRITVKRDTDPTTANVFISLGSDDADLGLIARVIGNIAENALPSFFGQKFGSRLANPDLTGYVISDEHDELQQNLISVLGGCAQVNELFDVTHQSKEETGLPCWQTTLRVKPKNQRWIRCLSKPS